jgi:hypothetical protein
MNIFREFLFSLHLKNESVERHYLEIFNLRPVSSARNTAQTMVISDGRCGESMVISEGNYLRVTLDALCLAVFKD